MSAASPPDYLAPVVAPADGSCASPFRPREGRPRRGCARRGCAVQYPVLPGVSGSMLMSDLCCRRSETSATPPGVLEVASTAGCPQRLQACRSCGWRRQRSGACETITVDIPGGDGARAERHLLLTSYRPSYRPSYRRAVIFAQAASLPGEPCALFDGRTWPAQGRRSPRSLAVRPSARRGQSRSLAELASHNCVRAGNTAAGP
jgi:hypothetical protein